MNDRAEHDRQRLIRLFWLYFALLIGEGVLRKWVMPQWSDALLIVRDPVAAAILFFAFRDRYLAIEGPMRSLVALLGAFVVLAAVQLTLTDTASVSVPLYGLRTYFLHPPLIFVMARVFDRRSLVRLTMALLVLAVPIALLMVLQFRAGPLDWINRGVGEAGLQIVAARGKIRPAGPFSFISGPVLYFAMVFACLIGSHVMRERIPAVAQWCGWASLLVAAAVSGSRSLVAGLVFVLITTVVALMAKPQLAGRFLGAALTVGTIVLLVWTASDVREGVDVLNIRIEKAGALDLIERSSGNYVGALSAVTDAPLFGAGIGLGTNAGSWLLGARGFRLGENEWTRVIFEAGPVLGLAYLLWRFALVFQLARAALRVASTGYVFPILLLGATVANLLTGQWGQPTTQGFAVCAAGMCLAACRLASLHLLQSQIAAARAVAVLRGGPLAAA